MSEMKYSVIKNEEIGLYLSPYQKECLSTIWDSIHRGRFNTGKSPVNYYLIVNIDEPYAGEVADLIEYHERAKGTYDHLGTLREYMGIAGEYQDPDSLNAELERYKGWVQDLQAGMYVNCVYCGHRYGPSDNVPVSMADALKQHIEQCPEHPMSKLRAQFETERQRVRDLENKEHMRQNLCSASCCDVAVQLEDTQAEAAAMRNALDSVYPLIAGRVMQFQKSGEIMAMEEWNAECIKIMQTLAPEAGKELLEEMRRLEDENTEILKQGTYATNGLFLLCHCLNQNNSIDDPSCRECNKSPEIPSIIKCTACQVNRWLNAGVEMHNDPEVQAWAEADTPEKAMELIFKPGGE